MAKVSEDMLEAIGLCHPGNAGQPLDTTNFPDTHTMTNLRIGRSRRESSIDIAIAVTMHVVNPLGSRSKRTSNLRETETCIKSSLVVLPLARTPAEAMSTPSR